MITLQTERLVIRTPTARDAGLYAEYRVRNRAKHAASEPLRSESYFSQGFWKSVLKEFEQRLKRDVEYRFCVFQAENSSRIVALVNLYAVNRAAMQSALMGYSVDGDFEGRGYATEAVRSVIEWAFGPANLHRIEAGVLPTNLASIRVLEKSGFVRVGLMHKSLCIQGEWKDHFLYDIVNPNWRSH